MKDALNKYSGTKNLNKTIPDSWPKIGQKHIQVYKKINLKDTNSLDE